MNGLRFELTSYYMNHGLKEATKVISDKDKYVLYTFKDGSTISIKDYLRGMVSEVIIDKKHMIKFNYDGYPTLKMSISYHDTESKQAWETSKMDQTSDYGWFIEFKDDQIKLSHAKLHYHFEITKGKGMKVGYC